MEDEVAADARRRVFAAHGAEEAAEKVGAADADDSPVLPCCCRAVGVEAEVSYASGPAQRAAPW